jgi:hypothetical protein
MKTILNAVFQIAMDKEILSVTMEAYTILIDFQIGTRVGELVVLKKEDMLDNEAYIHKMEIVDEERVDGAYTRKGYKIVEYVKHVFPQAIGPFH